MKLHIRPNAASDTTPVGKAARLHGDDSVTVIVEVLRDGYVPDAVRLRGHIGDNPRLFTGETLFRNIPTLRHDPEVDKVTVSRDVRLVAGQDTAARTGKIPD